VSNHYAFDEIPPDERLIFPEPKTAAERYANSVHLADRYLAVFFEELRRRDTLRDSLVILVGDHSFPTGEHGYSFNQIGYFEENFRTSLVLWWPDRLQPKRIGEGAWSQLDLAPSLMDLIGIQAENHFIGTSLFSAQPHAIPLIQPFDGKYLAVVRFPFKYVFHLRTGAERLFDLERDPQESVDLTDDSRGASRLVDLRRDLEMIFVNQSLIESDRIWPP
jgi:arylsulfatase A-like enzyme